MKGRKKTGQNILHYVIASNVVIVFIIAILGCYLFRFYYKKMQEDFSYGQACDSVAAQG